MHSLWTCLWGRSTSTLPVGLLNLIEFVDRAPGGSVPLRRLGVDTVLEELGTASQQLGAEPQPHAWFRTESGHAARPRVDVLCRNPAFCG